MRRRDGDGARLGAATKREALYSPRLLLLALTVGVSFMGVGFVLPLRAIYGQQLGASAFEIGLMASAALLSGFITAPGIGWLADRVGQRRVLWIGLLAHGVLVLAYIPARSPVALIGLRALEGIAIVGIAPPARALMNGLAPRSRQGEALGILSSAQMVGLMLGPALGTLLASQVGYGTAFLVAAAPLFVGALLARLFLPAHVAVGEVVGERGGDAPVRARGAVFSPQLRLTYALSATIALTQGVISALWAIYMLMRGASLELIGLSYTVYAVIALVLAPLSGRFSDRRGRYRPILVSLVIYAAIYCAYALPVSAIWLVSLSATEGIAGGIVRSALDGLLADVTPLALRGRVQANYTAASTGGAFVMAALAGVLYGVSPGLPFAVVGLAFFAACAGLLIPTVRRLFPEHTGLARRDEAEEALAGSVEVVVARGGE